MNKRIPPLPALRAFEAAARHMSFARAANELHVTAAAISHQVKQLEHWLGVPLFARTANGVSLTAAGRDYALRIQDVFERLVATSRAVRDHRERVVVSIRAQFSVAAMWLVPRVVALNRQQSDIEIRVTAAEHRATGRLGADIAIYFQRAELPGHAQVQLLSRPFRAYAAPSFIGRLSRIAPADLVAQPLLHISIEDRGWPSPGFDDWFEAAGVETRGLLPGLHFNLAHLAASACMQGAGVALLPEDLCVDAVRQGALVALPGPALPTPHPYFLMARNEVTEEVAWVRDAVLKSAGVAAGD
ncbi:MAG: LysR family transcriptional regulator [Betaproteobacteria bacterium]|nr:LysR family transcriptional regulator [Betaproteobacteria bacterium]